MLPPGHTQGFHKKNFNQIGSAVWPAMANINTNIYERRALLYSYWRFTSPRFPYWHSEIFRNFQIFHAKFNTCIKKNWNFHTFNGNSVRRFVSSLFLKTWQSVFFKKLGNLFFFEKLGNLFYFKLGNLFFWKNWQSGFCKAWQSVFFKLGNLFFFGKLCNLFFLKEP